jgi:hypothetical protein
MKKTGEPPWRKSHGLDVIFGQNPVDKAKSCTKEG